MGLHVENLSFGYHCFSVLKEINFTAEEGNLICVLGKNGAGKSTLFRCILGLLKGYKGNVSVNNQNVKKLKEKEMAKKIAYIPQNHSSTFAFSVLDMVMMGTTSSLNGFSNPGKYQKQVAMNALRMMNIENLATRTYTHISGGEQQLVLIARAIAQEAKILIMDEPCANLDYGNQIRVMKELKRLAGEGYLIVQSTHNPEHAFLYADQAMVLMDGRIAAMGEPSKVLTEELLEKIYDISLQLYEVEDSDIKVCIPDRGGCYVEAI